MMVATHDAQLAAAMDRVIELPLLRRVQEQQRMKREPFQCARCCLLGQMAPRKLWLGGAALAALTVLMGMALLGLSGWFITATALAGLVPATALVFDVFMPSAGIRLLAVGRTGARYAERLVTHDATLAVLAALRQRLFLSWARPQGARLLLQRPAGCCSA
jgi:ATP-binding cassette subfamily C protein CydC